MQKRKCFGKAFTAVGLQRQGMSKGDIIKVHSLKAALLLKGRQHFVAFGADLQQKCIFFFGKGK